MIPSVEGEPPVSGGRHRAVPGPLRIALALALAASVASGCDLLGRMAAPAPGAPLPPPVCGGLKIAIEGALSCQRIASIAIETLAARAPDQLARGVTSIRVELAQCPRGEVPPMIDCTNTEFAQMVTVTFPEPRPGGPIEPSLTVAIEPASGRVLGISNPLIL